MSTGDDPGPPVDDTASTPEALFDAPGASPGASSGAAPRPPRSRAPAKKAAPRSATPRSPAAKASTGRGAGPAGRAPTSRTTSASGPVVVERPGAAEDGGAGEAEPVESTDAAGDGGAAEAVPAVATDAAADGGAAEPDVVARPAPADVVARPSPADLLPVPYEKPASPSAPAGFLAAWPDRAVAAAVGLLATVALLVLGVVATGLAASAKQGTVGDRIGAAFVGQVGTADGLALLLAAALLAWAAHAGAAPGGPFGVRTLRWIVLGLAVAMFVAAPFAAWGDVSYVHRAHQTVDLVLRRQLATYLAVTMIPDGLAGLFAWWAGTSEPGPAWVQAPTLP